MQCLLVSPVRLGFGTGALMLAAIALWWAWTMLWPARVSGLPTLVVHGLLMTWGFLPLFIAGFLFTAVPRWLGCAPVAARSLLPAIGAQLAGWCVFVLALAGDAARAPLLAAMGLACVAAGWNSLVWRYLRLVRRSTQANRTHARLLLAACLCGTLLLDATVAAVAAQAWNLVRALVQGALWGCMGVAYAAALHRMIPFFGSGAEWLESRWPQWLLWTLVGVMALQAMLRPALLLIGPPEGGLRLALRLGHGALGVLGLVLAWRWSRLQGARQRLPAMLHRGFAWLGAALLLLALEQHAAALHAYVLGFLGTSLLAMASRIACGQTGRTVVADDFLWLLHWLLQAAVLLRLSAALWPTSAYWNGVLAALAWAGMALGWWLRYGNWLGRPALVRARR
ncbi:NnrS family protein [Azohydromonas aeria]|uniref:NnrS family protein n=1 Tax=Azohydromonas aeria TaxID=2590212 RepID=UPI0012F84D02|nr:NnrS family protein [Azohydromonas aeria]